MTEGCAQFVLFCAKTLAQQGKPTPTAVGAFEAAAANATIPQLQAFGKSLLQSGSWKKALWIASYLHKREGTTTTGWQASLQLLSKM